MIGPVNQFGMEDILIAILKGGELVADFCGTIYERVFSDDEADEQENEVRE